MKQKVILILSLGLYLNLSAQHFRLGGNSTLPAVDDITIPGNNFLGSNTGFNIPINIRTNGFTRMLIFNGGNGINDGRIAISNDLPSGFVPQARLHLHQTVNLGLNDPYIRFTNASTGLTNTDGFTIGNSTQFFPTTNIGQVDVTQFETAPIIVKLPNFNPSYTGSQPYEWMRIQNGQPFLAAPTAPSRVTDGYIG